MDAAEPTVRLSVNLPVELDKAFRKRAKAKRMTITEATHTALARWLEEDER